MGSGETGPIFVPRDAGTALHFLGVTHKLTSRQTNGTLYLFESTFDPGMGNRLHLHHREDEIGYVLEGALEFRLEHETRVLETGGLARLPKGLAHAIRNPLEVASRICSSPSPVVSMDSSMLWRERSVMAC